MEKQNWGPYPYNQLNFIMLQFVRFLRSPDSKATLLLPLKSLHMSDAPVVLTATIWIFRVDLHRELKLTIPVAMSMEAASVQQ